MADIGTKIKFFRTRENFSQHQLEVAISAAAGSVSRIENNQINPTKETIQKIAAALNLNKYEINYLLTDDFGKYTHEELNLALNEVSKTLKDPFTLAYLLDDYNRIVGLSDTFHKVFNMNEEEIVKYENANLLEVMVYPDAPGYKFLSEEAYPYILKRTLTRIIADTPFLEIEEYWQNLIPKLKVFPHFKKIWDEVKSEGAKLDTYTFPSRTVDFNFNGQIVPLSYSQERLITNPGFHLIIYTPSQDFIELMKQSYEA